VNRQDAGAPRSDPSGLPHLVRIVSVGAAGAHDPGEPLRERPHPPRRQSGPRSRSESVNRASGVSHGPNLERIGGKEIEATIARRQTMTSG
jgi:hypothetical protein